jgi:hypothetical protein
MTRTFLGAFFLTFAGIVLSPVLGSAETLIAGTGGSPPVMQSSFTGLLSGINEYATSFTVPAGTSYTLTHLQLAAFHYPGNGGTATFTIKLDSAGVPGSALVTFNTSTIEAFTEATAGLTLTPAGSPLLAGDQKYWIVGQSTSDQVNWVHAFNKFGETAGGDGTTWQVGQGSNVPAFAVLGVAVPEPSTLTLLVIVLGAMFVPRSGHSRHP